MCSTLSDADFIEKSVIKAAVKEKHGASQPAQKQQQIKGVVTLSCAAFVSKCHLAKFLTKNIY